jgi:hypothetical protein
VEYTFYLSYTLEILKEYISVQAIGILISVIAVWVSLSSQRQQKEIAQKNLNLSLFNMF